MTAEQYARWTAWLRARPGAVRVLALCNTTLTYLGYVAYPLLLVLVALRAPELLARMIVVPLALFVALSAFRYLYNASRPYEALDIDPLIRKSTVGKSFPSRHIFSMVMIALCWLRFCVPVGCALLVCAVVMAVIRVLGGVHFPRDVVAGALFAVVGGVLGLWIAPIP